MPQSRHLLCPVCRQKLTLNSKSAVCSRGHNFDRARQGYLNLHLSSAKTPYTKTLYQARQHLFNNGVFDPLVSSLSTLLLRQTPIASPTVLDAGCGDGSLLAALIGALSQHNRTPSGLGLDICKDAVKIASHAHSALTWCVADLAQPPVADNTQDILINILAPAKYSEFARLLTSGGILAKVMPGPEHFKEIRQVLQTPQKSDDTPWVPEPTLSVSTPVPNLSTPTPNLSAPTPSLSPPTPWVSALTPKPYPTEMPQTMDHAKPYFTILETHRLTYDVSAVNNIEHFIQMSPLAWHTLPEKKESALSGRLQNIRLDYILILARSKT